MQTAHSRSSRHAGVAKSALTSRRTAFATTTLCVMATVIQSAPSRAADAGPEAMLRRVADHVLERTTRRLVDRETGEFFTHSDGLAPLVLERRLATGDPRHDPFLGRMRRFLAGCARFDDGLLYRKGKGAMTDDPFMTVPFLVRESRFDEAIPQVLATHARLLDGERRLLKHLWDEKTGRPAGEFWGRGNGWTVLAHVELLAALPREHPRRGAVLAAFVRHMEGVRESADPAGGWHQVLDHPESWLETSATGMLTYGMARGVNEGWLDPSFAETARKGWKALETKVLPDGDLVDVCGSTDTGDLRFYLNRQRLQGDLHGFGSFLLAGAEIVRMQNDEIEGGSR